MFSNTEYQKVTENLRNGPLQAELTHISLASDQVLHCLLTEVLF